MVWEVGRNDFFDDYVEQGVMWGNSIDLRKFISKSNYSIPQQD